MAINIRWVNKTIGPGGIVRGQLWLGDILCDKGKVFFPPHWTREKVVEEILQMYEKFKGPLKMGKFNCPIIEETIDENILVRIVLDPKTQVKKTAFPVHDNFK